MYVRKLVCILGLVSWGAVPALAADDGHKRTQELVKGIQDTVKEINEGRKRLEQTLAAYQELFSGEERKRRAAYQDLVKSLDRQEERSKKLRERFKQLDKKAEKYFDAWNKSLKDIKERGLRDRSATRLEETRRRYQELVRTGEQARQGFRPVVEGLEDQVVYLEHDLNQTAVESLAEDRAKIDEASRNLMTRIDGFTADADAYVASLKQ